MPELLDVVDENNRIIGKEQRDVIHSKGLFHRSVHIFVFNSHGLIFLQKRSAKKDICPLKWDLSAAEHMKPSENYEDAAVRGLEEELGIKTIVTRIRKVHLQKFEYIGGKIKDYEFIELYKATYDGQIKIDKNEVADGSFFKIEDVKNMIKQNKNQFTPWFLDEWKYMEQKGLV